MSHRLTGERVTGDVGTALRTGSVFDSDLHNRGPHEAIRRATRGWKVACILGTFFLSLASCWSVVNRLRLFN